MGLPQLVVKYNRGKIARYGINIEELNTIIRTAYAGEASGVVSKTNGSSTLSYVWIRRKWQT